MAYEIVFDSAVVEHLRSIERKHHGLIRQTIHDQLAFEPSQPTRNRKPLTRETRFGLAWELRFGPNNRFRVFYRIEEAQSVRVLAVLVKEGNRLYMGGEEIEL